MSFVRTGSTQRIHAPGWRSRHRQYRQSVRRRRARVTLSMRTSITSTMPSCSPAARKLALAKRIDEAQRALLICLCRIPLIVERVGAGVDQLREGRLRWSYLLDAVPSDELEATDDNLFGDDGSLDVSAETVELIPRLELVAALSAEIAALARKRIAALARGKELSLRERRRLDELLSRAVADIADLHLQQDRISDLVAEVDTDARR